MDEVHIMVDIETLSNDVKSGVILSVGAVVFDPLGASECRYPPEYAFTGEMLNLEGTHGHFYSAVSLETSMSRGLVIEAETLKWWLRNGRAGRLASVVNGPSQSFYDVFRAFSSWLQGHGDQNELYLWSHGSAYDLAHIENKYKYTLSLCLPFSFRNVRDTRTIFALYRAKYGKDVEWPVKQRNHHALEDAWAQAVAVSRAWSTLCPQKPETGSP